MFVYCLCLIKINKKQNHDEETIVLDVTCLFWVIFDEGFVDHCFNNNIMKPWILLMSLEKKKQREEDCKFTAHLFVPKQNRALHQKSRLLSAFVVISSSLNWRCKEEEGKKVKLLLCKKYKVEWLLSVKYS